MIVKDIKQAAKQNGRTLGETLIILQEMVDSFVGVNHDAWEKVREAYKKEHGFPIGVSLSMQSYVGSDLLIDFAYLAKATEDSVPFKREYWIRSQGVQCIKNEEDKDINRNVWGDILGKIRLEYDGTHFNGIEWFEDEDCKIKNLLIDKGLLYERYY